MIINRTWAMPNSKTFKIKPIRELILKYTKKPVFWIDPFAGHSTMKKYCISTNDLNLDCETNKHMEALDYLKTFNDNSVGGVLFDPPYSARQIKECYGSIGRKVHQEDTQGSFYTKKKEEIARIVMGGGIVISFGWSSMGIGKSRGFEIVEILLVPHGGVHYDTICVVEKKMVEKREKQNGKEILQSSDGQIGI